jgi:CheY-like chemotaxis protein
MMFRLYLYSDYFLHFSTLVDRSRLTYDETMSKIAIIEDDPVISQMYRMKFEADGFEVQLANNGKRGVAMVESFAPDLILMDLQMPEMGGAEALAFIRKHEWGKDVPVIILTNLGQEESPKEIQALGIHSYIVKAELTPRQVVQRVKEALGN